MSSKSSKSKGGSKKKGKNSINKILQNDNEKKPKASVADLITQGNLAMARMEVLIDLIISINYVVFYF